MAPKHTIYDKPYTQLIQRRKLTPKPPQLIRDGHYSVADLMSIGKTMLGRRHVLPSVLATLVELQVEGTFISGTYLVTVHHPISSDEGDLERALYGSFLPVPAPEAFPDPDPQDFMPEKMPGAVIPAKHARVELSVGKRRIRLKVMSKGDRPIQVCTSYLIPGAERGKEKRSRRSGANYSVDC
jgi:Urea amidohydrolase (urease) gamma subunit